MDTKAREEQKSVKLEHIGQSRQSNSLLNEISHRSERAGAVSGNQDGSGLSISDLKKQKNSLSKATRNRGQSFAKSSKDIIHIENQRFPVGFNGPK